MFKYVFIPADSSLPLAERRLSKEGGLDNDLLRKTCQEYFSQSSLSDEQKEEQKQLLIQSLNNNNTNASYSQKDLDNLSQQLSATLNSASVEIITLLLPLKDNNYQSVSMYTDQNGQLKGLPYNERATEILRECLYKDKVIYGDAFISKVYDDENYPWERIDFTIEEDMNLSNSKWIQIAKQVNINKNLSGQTTSGMLQNFMKNQSSGSSSSDKLKVIQDGPIENNYNLMTTSCPYITWKQNNEEVEIYIKLNKNIEYNKKLFNIKLLYNKISVTYQNQNLYIDLNLDSSIDQILTSNGSLLYEIIDTDSSTWSIERNRKEKNNLNEIEENNYLILVLYKNKEKLYWPNLVKN